MKITILDGEPDGHSAFAGYVDEYVGRLTAAGHDVTAMRLRDMDIRGCSGCWGCWVKTPGECVKRDESAIVRRAFINADLVVLASPMIMGTTSALLKRTMDQMIPLIHPYIVIEGGEEHHRPRYAHYPELGLLLSAGDDTDAEDIAITEGMWSRTARNVKSRLAFTAVADRSALEVADELTAVA
jgi:multimeric flavodoxin WrbA